MNVVDSSGWIEYFSNGKNADFFALPILDAQNLIVPSICFYEVFKRISLLKNEEEALMAVGLMSYGQEVELVRELAVSAAGISLEHKLPMADSIILATSQAFDALLWTQDEHFINLADVRFIGND